MFVIWFKLMNWKKNIVSISRLCLWMKQTMSMKNSQTAYVQRLEVKPNLLLNGTPFAEKTPRAAETRGFSPAKHKPPPLTTTAKTIRANERANVHEISHDYVCRCLFSFLMQSKNSTGEDQRYPRPSLSDGGFETGKLWTAHVPPTLNTLLICSSGQWA